MSKNKYLSLLLSIFLVSLAANILSNPVKHKIKSVITLIGLYNESSNADVITSNLILGPTAQHKGDEIYLSVSELNDFIKRRIDNELFFTEESTRKVISERLSQAFANNPFNRHNTQKILNIRELGARCDGKTDDTAAFQSAFNLANENDFIFIFVPSGICMVNPMVVSSNTVVFCVGNSSVIKLLPQKLIEAQHWAILRVHGVQQRPVKNVFIFNLMFDGSKNEHKGKAGSFHEAITLDWGRNSALFDLTIVNTVHNGIQVDGARDIAIFGNFISSADGTGIHLSDNGEGKHRGSKNILVWNNYVQNSGFAKDRSGIDQNPNSYHNLFINNVAKGNSKNYIFFNEVIVNRNNISLE